MAKATHNTPTVVRTLDTELRKRKICKISAGETVCSSLCDLAGWDFARGGQGVSTPGEVERNLLCRVRLFYDLLASRDGFKSDGEIPELRRFSQTAWLGADARAQWSCCPVLAQ